jgi:hypothetical protein
MPCFPIAGVVVQYWPAGLEPSAEVNRYGASVLEGEPV